MFDLTSFLYQKECVCPVCGDHFKDTYIKRSRLRLKRVKKDLRLIYHKCEPLFYDLTLCPNCGYSVIKEDFPDVTPAMKDAVAKKMLPYFKFREYPLVLTFEQAIERYKVAIYNLEIGQSSDGDKGYLCLKLVWLYQSYQSTLIKRKKCLAKPLDKRTEQDWDDKFNLLGIGSDITEEAEIAFLNEKLKKIETPLTTFRDKLIDHFEKAYYREAFPIKGLTIESLEYLLAAFHFEADHFDKAKNWLSVCYGHQDLRKTLRDKAYDLNQAIRKTEKERKKAEKESNMEK